EAVLATATEALDALGVRTGCVHTEVKLTPGGPRVIEVNGRMGGGVPDILAAAGGPDLLALHLGAALGRPLGLDGPVRTQRIGYRLFLQPPVSARRLCSVGGLRQLGEIPGVESVSLHLRPGDAIDPQGGTRSFVLAIVGHADRPDEVRRASQLMEELADVVYEHATAEHATAEHAAAEHATDGAAPLATVSMAVA
ncbi:MAG: hypothetical protein ACRDWN_07275, partial [Acidimicrobiales bacterium]